MADVGVEPPFQAYTGNSPFVFVSYAHRDAPIVYPELKGMHELGYRIWFDEGIDPGNEWPDEIANALSRSAQFLVFITPNAVASRNVRNEIQFALDHGKPFIAVHLCELQLPLGLQLSIGALQAVLKYRMSAFSYWRKMEKALPTALLDARALQSFQDSQQFGGTQKSELHDAMEPASKAIRHQQAIPAAPSVAPSTFPHTSVDHPSQRREGISSVQNSKTPSECPKAWFPMTPDEARQAQCGVAQAMGVPEQIEVGLTDVLRMKFRFIPPGDFIMGSVEYEEGRAEDEMQHRVTLTRGFYLGLVPVTRAQWSSVMAEEESFRSYRFSIHPEGGPSWLDASVFCKRLSTREGLSFRLPTEAEWEFACRAGTATQFNTGNGATALNEAGWFAGNQNAEEDTSPVARKRPNSWGLYDMHGNVAEHCLDGYSQYPSRATIDPRPPLGESGIVRGGAFRWDPRGCRAASRNKTKPLTVGHSDWGLRVVVDVASLSPSDAGSLQKYGSLSGAGTPGFLKSAEAGSASDQYRLAVYYLSDIGRASSVAEAFKWATRSAELGHPDAQELLGYLYFYGLGIDRNPESALAWVQKAAEQGSGTAQQELAYRYRYGMCVAKNERTASHWDRTRLRTLAEHGDESAKKEQRAEAWRQRLSDGVSVLEFDARAGNTWAMLAIADLYFKNEKNASQALPWVLRAVDKGNASAMYMLCWAYRFGQGTDKDPAQALYWCRRAAEAGLGFAQEVLGELLKKPRKP